MAPITTAWNMEVTGRHLGKDSETLIKCMTEKQPMWDGKRERCFCCHFISEICLKLFKSWHLCELSRGNIILIASTVPCCSYFQLRFLSDIFVELVFSRGEVQMTVGKRQETCRGIFHLVFFCHMLHTFSLEISIWNIWVTSIPSEQRRGTNENDKRDLERHPLHCLQPFSYEIFIWNIWGTEQNRTEERDKWQKRRGEASSILSSSIQTPSNPKHRHIVWLGASLGKKFIKNFNKLMRKKKKESLDSVRTPEREKKIKFESWREQSLAVWEFTRERIGENDFNTVEGKVVWQSCFQDVENGSTPILNTGVKRCVIWGIWKGSRLIADFPFYPSSHLSARLVLENPQTLPKINFEKSLEGKWNTKLYFSVFKWLSYQQIRQTRCLKTPICPHILKPIKETTS